MHAYITADTNSQAVGIISFFQHHQTILYQLIINTAPGATSLIHHRIQNGLKCSTQSTTANFHRPTHVEKSGSPHPPKHIGQLHLMPTNVCPFARHQIHDQPKYPKRRSSISPLSVPTRHDTTTYRISVSLIMLQRVKNTSINTSTLGITTRT